MQLKFFGKLAEVTGKPTMEITSIADTDSLLNKLLQDFPKLKEYNILIAVDKKIVKQNQQLESHNEVALLPPFAGG
ncbi:MAG: MoaD/ThiS family protein [Bacteroidia bacterium]